MKFIILPIVCLLLISFNSKGQKNYDSKKYPPKYQNFIKSDSSKRGDDTLFAGITTPMKLKTDTFLIHKFDSLKIGKLYGKRIPSFGQKKLNQDIIVLDPGPFRDKMPNANVTTPGVHYHLKIIPYKTIITTPKKDSLFRSK